MSCRSPGNGSGSFSLIIDNRAMAPVHHAPVLSLATVFILRMTGAQVVEPETNKLNVYGLPLESCSKTGMAKTGFMREAICAHYGSDTGSHNICIDIAKLEPNFCEVTKQTDWCHSKMFCMDEPTKLCPVQDWCVCEWAFARYLAEAGGCDKIGSYIICEATSIMTIQDYEGRIQMENDEQAMHALECIKKKCAIP
jgi:uncharacterized protein (DUF2237 family)